MVPQIQTSQARNGIKQMMSEKLIELSDIARPIIEEYSKKSDKVTVVTPFKKKRGLNVITSSELGKKTFPPIKWAVENLIPEGLTVLAGAPKVGKSWFCLGLGIGIASGSTVFGKIPVEQGRVLYLALEDGQRRIQERLKKLNSGLVPDLQNLAIVTKIEPDEPIHQAIEEDLQDNPNTRLVIVDVYARVKKQSSNQNANSYAEDYKDAEKWKQIADQYGTAILLVHHTRKQGAEDFINAVSGTNGLTGASDTILHFGRARNSSDATLEITSRDAPENRFAFVKDGLSWKMLGEADLLDLTETRRTILQIVEQSNGITPKEVSEQCRDITYDNVKQTLLRMFNEGQIKNVSGMYYPNETYVLDFN